MSKEKDQLTKQFLKERQKLSTEEITSSSELLWRMVQALDFFREARRIMMYIPIRGELDFTPYFEELYRNGIELSIPVLDEEDEELMAALWTPEEVLVPKKYNIMEPEMPKFVDLQHLEVVIIPGVAFDQNGGRLGFGKGYYDRFLKTCHALRVGMAYDFQVLPEVPTNELDVPMDYIITPTRVMHLPENYTKWRFFGSDI
jgi:5-formyltetrahydrofolate cyclo-ligase